MRTGFEQGCDQEFLFWSYDKVSDWGLLWNFVKQYDLVVFKQGVIAFAIKTTISKTISRFCHEMTKGKYNKNLKYQQFLFFLFLKKYPVSQE